MMCWMMFSFQDFSSMNMFNMKMVIDNIMVIMIFIIIYIMKLIIFLMLNSFINKVLNENQLLEFFWILIPLIMILFMMLFSLKILYVNSEMKFNFLILKIVGNQWFWNYEFMNFNKIINCYMFMKCNFNFNLIETDNKLILPFNSQILMITSSSDVIHSWSIPSINIKMDSMPNQLNNFLIKINKVGVLFGQCSEICGINHSFMPVNIEVVLMDDFIKWIKFLSILN